MSGVVLVVGKGKRRRRYEGLDWGQALQIAGRVLFVRFVVGVFDETAEMVVGAFLDSTGV